MAEVNALILPIGADASSFQKSINDVKLRIKELSAIIKGTPFNLVKPEQLKELGQLEGTLKRLTQQVKNTGDAFKAPANSIEGLTQKINELNKKRITLDAKTSAAEIAKLRKEIDDLTQKRTNLENLGRSAKTIAPALDQVTDASKRARTTLTSLTLIAQDLPFGFIGIQNNIPALLQQFSLLREDTKSTRNAFAELGKQFTGPVGLLFAVSAVSSVITALVQKYGSLGNAIDAIVGKSITLKDIQNKLSKEYIELNNQTAGEISNLQSLVSILTNSNSTRNQQIGAQDELNKKYPALLANIDDENIKTGQSIQLIAARTRLITQQIQLEGRREALIKLIGQSAVEGEKALAEIGKFKAGELSVFEDVALGLRSFLQGTSPLLGSLGQAKILVTDFSNAAKANAFFEEQLAGVNLQLTSVNGEIKQILDSLEANKKKVKELDDAEEDAAKKRLAELLRRKKALEEFNRLTISVPELKDANSAEKRISTLEKYGNILLDTSKYDFERADALNKVISVDQEYFKGLDLNKQSLVELQDIIDRYIHNLQIQQIEQSGALAASKLEAQAYKNTQKELAELNKEEDKRFKLAVKESMVFDNMQNSTRIITQNNNDYLQTLGYQQYFTDKLVESEKERTKNVKELAREFRFLQEPLEGLIGTALEGAGANWKEFADTVIAQIKRIIAALAAKALIQGLANILTPGSGLGGAITSGLEGISTEGLGSWLDMFPSAANFSGVQPGGLQMAGAVNLTLRGNDLVGAINRTNTNINRVG